MFLFFFVVIVLINKIFQVSRIIANKVRVFSMNS